MSLTLRAGEWEAELRPEVGGALSALRFRGIEVLRTMPPGATDPLQSACFPLAPYCNRIREGRFSFGGMNVSLPPNFPPERHSLHGLSWQRPWQIESSAENKCVLADEYYGEGPWPWTYRAEQRIRLGETGCAITLVLTNRSDAQMPAGIGLHPYFRRSRTTRLHLSAGHVLLSDGELLPTGITAPADHFADFQQGASLPAETIDHCFAGWRGEVSAEDEFGAIVMNATGAPNLHLFAPMDGSAMCCEPVSHTPDALNRAPQEMTVLAPGCSTSMTMRIGAA